jgi:SAM-dependent methyltransferase
MTANGLDTRRYWETRLQAKANLRGTGHRAFSEEYNRVLYAAQAECLDGMFAYAGIAIAGSNVLDVGSGVGFFINYYRQRGADAVIGTDLTFASAQYLRQNAPGADILQCDVTAPALPLGQSFAIVNCVSVLYHVLDDARFAQALTNLCRAVGPQGCLILNDGFKRAPTARHARFRALETYAAILAQHQMTVAAVVPAYFTLNRTFVPLLGPWLIDRLHLSGRLKTFDQRLRAAGVTAGASMHFLLATRA